jgi:MmyB-like transcription regulator ligand binding domain
VRPTVQRILDALTGLPAFVQSNRFDILAANPLGRALYSEMFAGTSGPVNTPRFVFLDPRGPRLYVDWECIAGKSSACCASRRARTRSTATSGS